MAAAGQVHAWHGGAAHIDERLHEQHEEGVDLEGDRQQVVKEGRGPNLASTDHGGSGGAHAGQTAPTCA